jgi:predicted ATPase
LRIEAEAILKAAAGATQTAEAKLLQSVDIAREQSVLSFELRSVASLARLWRHTGRLSKARNLLQETYGRFTEGFATNDLLGARQLIDEFG